MSDYIKSSILVPTPPHSILLIQSGELYFYVCWLILFPTFSLELFSNWFGCCCFFFVSVRIAGRYKRASLLTSCIKDSVVQFFLNIFFSASKLQTIFPFHKTLDPHTHILKYIIWFSAPFDSLSSYQYSSASSVLY